MWLLHFFILSLYLKKALCEIGHCVFLSYIPMRYPRRRKRIFLKPNCPSSICWRLAFSVLKVIELTARENGRNFCFCCPRLIDLAKINHFLQIANGQAPKCTHFWAPNFPVPQIINQKSFGHSFYFLHTNRHCIISVGVDNWLLPLLEKKLDSSTQWE